MHLLAIDGNSILNRAFYGLKLLSTKDGFHTNAIYGFLNMLLKIERETNPDAVAIAFDLKKPTFRHRKYEAYKAKRKAMPQELAEQLPVLKELLTYLGYSLVECEGYEADDILGTLAYNCSINADKCTIATGDKDALQLVNDQTYVLLLTTKSGQQISTLFDNKAVFEKYKLHPKQLIDLKAIQGDLSDNIPGVKGIGEKGASDLIVKYESIDKIYDKLEDLKIRDSIKEKLRKNKDTAYLSYDLGRIRKDAPIDVNIRNYIKKSANTNSAYELMLKLELVSLIDKLGIKDQVSQDESKIKLITFKISTVDNIKNLHEMHLTSKDIYLLYEAEEKSIKKVAFTDGKEYIYLSEDSKVIQELFSSNYNWIVHDSKKLYNFISQKKNLIIKFDSMLAAYLLNPSSKDYNVEKLIEKYINNLSLKINIDIPDGLKYHEHIIDNLAHYPELCKIMSNEINRNNQDALLKNVEIKLSKVLHDMETQGFEIDTKGIESFSNNLSIKIDRLTQDIYSLAGCEFNINSPKQLGEILYQKLDIALPKSVKTTRSTNAEILEQLRYDYPIVGLILEYRSLSKLRSTYCDAMLRLKDSQNKIHTKFNQTETRTGRISSLEPNLQNIPIRTELGRQLRRFFRAGTESVLVDADYSQIELRVLAHISQDNIMIEAFKNGEDIHTITASQVFNMPQNLITPLMRTRAKAVNFGIIYGISAFSLAKSLDISLKEAKDYINNYKNRYHAVDDYMNNIVTKAKKDGFVSTLFNRRRYLPELKSSNFNLRSFGERVARNMPIQGTAADIIKIAMIKVADRLEKEGLSSHLILQIHDELIVETKEDEINIVKDILKSEMENAVSLSVPLTVQLGVGKTWYDTKN